jgi:GT2 family glycosyltransferase
LLRLDPSPQEILVVDNASRSDSTQQLVETMPNIRYVREPRPGLSTARNTGIRHSTGDVIAFTDEDVMVQSNWLAGLRRGFQDPNVQAVTGLILPLSLETEAQFVFQRGQGRYGWGYRPLIYDARFFEQMKRRGVPVWHIGAGANMAFRRSAFEQIGGFDERLGAGASGCSEDSEMWYRILAEGGQCRYEPTAVVHHYHRDDLEGLNHQMYQYMRGHMTALLVQFEKYRDVGNLYRAFGILPSYYIRLMLRAVRLGFRSESGTLGKQMRGCLAGGIYYLRHRHRPARPDVQNGTFQQDAAPPFSKAAYDHA